MLLKIYLNFFQFNIFIKNIDHLIIGIPYIVFKVDTSYT